MSGTSIIATISMSLTSKCAVVGRSCVRWSHFSPYSAGPQGFWGLWGECLFILRELGSTGNSFRGFGEQAHSFGDLGSLSKKLKKISP